MIWVCMVTDDLKIGFTLQKCSITTVQEDRETVAFRLHTWHNVSLLGSWEVRAESTFLLFRRRCHLPHQHSAGSQAPFRWKDSTCLKGHLEFMASNLSFQVK